MMDTPDQVATFLARNLISLRQVRGLTQDTVAKSAGVPRSTIANLESGQGNPTLTVLLKVANSLGVPVDELLGPGEGRADFNAKQQEDLKRKFGALINASAREIAFTANTSESSRRGRSCTPLRATFNVARTRVTSASSSNSSEISGISQSGGR